jgi:hypothetical protein
VIGLDTRQVRIAAERVTDQARVIFEGNYLREHVTLGLRNHLALRPRHDYRQVHHPRGLLDRAQ